jgi:hypothetical protein
MITRRRLISRLSVGVCRVTSTQKRLGSLDCEEEASKRATRLFTRAAKLASVPVLLGEEFQRNFDWLALCVATDIISRAQRATPSWNPRALGAKRKFDEVV